MVWPIQPVLKLVHVNLSGFDLAKQDSVIASFLSAVAPKNPVREDLKKRRDHALYRVGIAFVEGYPKTHYSIRVQMRLAHFVILNRVERGAAFDPGIDRIRGDDIEFLRRGTDEMPAVVENHFGTGIFNDSVILFFEHRRYHFRDQWFD